MFFSEGTVLCAKILQTIHLNPQESEEHSEQSNKMVYTKTYII